MYKRQVQQLHGVPPEPGHQRGRQPGLQGPPVGHGVVGADPGQYLGGPGPRARIPVQAVPYEVEQPGRYAGQVRFRFGAAQQECREAAGLLRVPEGQPPGGRVRKDRAEAEDVARGGDRLAADLLGGHEAGGADDFAGPGQADVVAGGGAGDAEVDDARPVEGDQHVRGLQVAVDDARAVDVLEGVREAGGQDPYGPVRQRTEVVGDDPAQARPGDVAGGEPGGRRLGVGVEDRGGPLAADPAGRGDLLAEPDAELLAGGEAGVDELDRDGAAAVGAGEVDLAHPSGAEP